MANVEMVRRLYPEAYDEAVALYSSLSNEEMIAARIELKAKLNQLFENTSKEGLLEWNHYAVHVRYLTESIDWGYVKGQSVLRSTHLGYVEDTILSISDSLYFFRTVGLGVDMLRKIDDDSVKRYSGPAKV